MPPCSSAFGFMIISPLFQLKRLFFLLISTSTFNFYFIVLLFSSSFNRHSQLFPTHLKSDHSTIIVSALNSGFPGKRKDIKVLLLVLISLNICESKCDTQSVTRTKSPAINTSANYTYFYICTCQKCYVTFLKNISYLDVYNLTVISGRGGRRRRRYRRWGRRSSLRFNVCKCETTGCF